MADQIQEYIDAASEAAKTLHSAGHSVVNSFRLASALFAAIAPKTDAAAAPGVITQRLAASAPAALAATQLEPAPAVAPSAQ